MDATPPPTATPTPPATLRPHKLFPWVLFFIGVALYATTVQNPFVFDDTAHLTEALQLTEWSDASDVLLGSRRGLTNLTFALNWTLGQDDPRGYHVVNLLIHALAGVVLYELARVTLRHGRRVAPSVAQRAPALAFAIALLWLVHPLCTQAVTYVIQRAEALMGLFYLLTLLGVARFAATKRLAWAAIAVAACWLGTVSKEVMATAPIVAVLYDRRFFAASFRQLLGSYDRDKPLIRRFVRLLYGRLWLHAALFASWVLFPFIGFGDIVGSDPTSAGFGVPLLNWWQYLLSQGEVILHYLRLVFLPFPLVLDYGWLPAGIVKDPAFLLWHVAVPVTCVVLLLGASVYGVVRNAWWGVLGFSFFAVLSVTSSVIPIVDIIFEHRMYLALAPVVALVVIAGDALLRRSMHNAASASRVGGVLVAVAAIALATLTFIRNNEYTSSVALWTTVAERVPDNPRGHHNLGQALGDAGRKAEAMEAYERALAIVPSFADAHHNLGQLWLDEGRPDRALPRFEQAVKFNPTDPESRYGLAAALAQLGRVDEAHAQLDEALRLEPRMAKALNLRGTLLAQAGDGVSAIGMFEQALQQEPGHAEATLNLAMALHHQGRYSEALPYYERALELSPENPTVLRQAARFFATAPDPGVRNGLRAVDLASRAAVREGNSDLRTLDTLAAAHAQAGQWSQAQSVARHVLRAAEQAGFPPEALAKLRERLRLYEAQQPYREAFAPAPTAVTPVEPQVATTTSVVPVPAAP